ncbi:hypothetical protein PV379_03765 [Streptomyces caniscabiei]|uniref:hypothetical protein n=1 Tax=Streptomyces caniscabiei TaxID=2746961 RepID=UPI0029BECF89|nr:hypothetical protein [Streptomyces caniscabiei]MDX2776457.1 hypothetical protein [Streptomyces caniscabiei]
MAKGTADITQTIRTKSNRFIVGVAVVVMVISMIPSVAVEAAQLTARKATLSSSAVGTVAAGQGVTYTFTFTPAATTAVQSMNIDFCTTASGACDPSASSGVPAGLTTTGAAISGTPTGLGTGGTWTGTFTTNGRLRIANASSTGTAGAATVAFSGITNPSAVNTSFYMRITTYSDSSFTTPIDTGTVAASTANQITVSASVDESLTFCTGTSGITNSSCAGATGASVNLGSLTPSTTGAGTSQIGAATNAGSGYAITVAGTTLTSGSNTITALASPTASTQGSEQFGINLAANTTPAVGQAPDGAGSATATADYATSNSFKFVSGNTIASTATADNFRRFTVSYMANVGNTTEPGTYQTTLTYVCTATF